MNIYCGDHLGFSKSSYLFCYVLIILSSCAFEESLNTEDPMDGGRVEEESGTINLAVDENTAEDQLSSGIEVDMRIIEECDRECPEDSTFDNCECISQNCECPTIYEPVCGINGQTYSNVCAAECEAIEIQFEGECRTELDCFNPYTEPNCEIFCKTVNLCVSDYCMYPNFAESFACLEACEDEPQLFIGGFWYNICDESNRCEEFISSLEGYVGESICRPNCSEPNPNVMYISENLIECEMIDFTCPSDAEYYYDECGCGCYTRDCNTECDGERDAPVCSPSGERFASECHANCAREYQYRPCEMACDCPTVYEPECGLDGVTYDNRCLRECVGVPLNYTGICSGELCSTPGSDQNCDRLCDDVVSCFDDQCSESELSDIRFQCEQACLFISPAEICGFLSCFDIPILLHQVSNRSVDCINLDLICPDEFTDAEYISYNPEACGLIDEFDCEDGESFSGPCGCGCLINNRCPLGDQARYVSYEPEVCERLSLSCPEGSEVFNNDCGCGCSF